MGRVAAMVDQNEVTSDLSSDDYSLRLNYLNRRERMWSEVGDWQCLYKEYNTLTSTNSGNTSIALPSDFRKLASYPKITADGVSSYLFSEVRGQEEGQYDQVNDHYVKILGNPNSSYYMKVNAGTSDGQLASGASIYISYYAYPASLASPTNVVTCPNPDYLIQGVVADIWEAREDARFQQAKVEAEIILKNMLEKEFTPTEAAAHDRVKTVEETKYAFRWGK